MAGVCIRPTDSGRLRSIVLVLVVALVKALDRETLRGRSLSPPDVERLTFTTDAFAGQAHHVRRLIDHSFGKR